MTLTELHKKLHEVTERFDDCHIKRKAIVGCLCNDRPHLFNDSRLQMDVLATEYNARLAKIAKEFQDSHFSDFSVVHDPGLGLLDFRNGSIDMISGADCFHPSQESHNRAGVSVWNNLFLPYERKRPVNIKTPNRIDCPDEESRIWAG